MIRHIPVDIPQLNQLNPHQFRLLYEYVCHPDTRALPVRQLAQRTGITEKTINKLQWELHELGFIEIQQTKRGGKITAVPLFASNHTGGAQ